LPYPVWVSDENKRVAIDLVKEMIRAALDGKSFSFTSREIFQLENIYQFTSVRRASQLEIGDERSLVAPESPISHL
jgi:hypothetical protein